MSKLIEVSLDFLNSSNLNESIYDTNRYVPPEEKYEFHIKEIDKLHNDLIDRHKNAMKIYDDYKNNKISHKDATESLKKHNSATKYYHESIQHHENEALENLNKIKK